MATPVLDFRAPRGLYIDPPVLRHRFRNSARVLPKAIIWLLSYCHLRSRNRFHGLGSLGSPHVCIRFRTSGGRCLLGDNHVYCCAHRCKDFELDRHNVGREPQIHSPDDVLGLTCVNVYYRWPIGCYALSSAS